MTHRPRRGEVWVASLDPVQGHEQAGKRPVLVLSVDAFNAGPSELVIVLPITSRARPIASRVAIRPPQGGLRLPSYVITEQLRTISRQRLSQRLGALPPELVERCAQAVRVFLGL